MASRSVTHTPASNMKAFLKILKWFGIILGSCGVLLIVYMSLGDWIRWQYVKLTWSPPDADGYLRVGISKNDISFYSGAKDVECRPREFGVDECRWSEESVGPSFYATLKDGKVSYWHKESKFYWDLRQLMPFSTISEMRELLGAEDLYAESYDGKFRRYTYLEYGVTYSFEQNRVKGVGMGEVTWRSGGGTGKPGASYIVKGKTVCPSPNCPWDASGNLKTAFKDKSYRDFLN